MQLPNKAARVRNGKYINNLDTDLDVTARIAMRLFNNLQTVTMPRDPIKLWQFLTFPISRCTHFAHLSRALMITCLDA